MKNPLLMLAAFCAVPAVVCADEKPTELEPVITIGTRSGQEQNRLPAAVVVITREQIERSGAQHIADVLRLAGALQLTDLYGDGSKVTVDLRGFGDAAHSSTLVLVDGRRLNNPDIAPPDLSTIALQDVERIEILEGSAGTLYGDQAVGGVINIVTRVPQGLTGAGSATAGSYDALGAHASVAQRWDALSLRLSGGARGTDNYRDHNALEHKNVLGRAGYDGASAGVFVEAGYTDQDLETPGALSRTEVEQDPRQASANFRGDFADDNSGFVRVNWRQALGEAWTLTTDFDHRRANGTFRLSSIFGPATSDAHQDRELRGLRPRLAGTLPGPWGDALVTAGADGQLAEYEITSAFGHTHDWQRIGEVYAQGIVPLPAAFEITAGGRYARMENEVRDTFIFTERTRFHDVRPAGELGLSQRPWTRLRWFARADRTVRFAKVDEFTATNAPAGSGVVDVQTQTGNSYELGAEWTPATVRTRVTLYRLYLQNEIAFDPVTFTNVNLAPSRRDGLIVEARAVLPAGLEAGATAHWIDSRLAGGRTVPLVPRRAAKAWVQAPLPGRLRAHLEAHGVGPRAYAGDFDGSLDDLPGHAVVNAALQLRPGRWHAGLRINNVLDAQYAEYGAESFLGAESYFPSPARNGWLEAGFEF